MKDRVHVVHVSYYQSGDRNWRKRTGQWTKCIKMISLLFSRSVPFDSVFKIKTKQNMCTRRRVFSIQRFITSVIKASVVCERRENKAHMKFYLANPYLGEKEKKWFYVNGRCFLPLFSVGLKIQFCNLSNWLYI